MLSPIDVARIADRRFGPTALRRQAPAPVISRLARRLLSPLRTHATRRN
jgi:hypothetical protein